MAKSMGQYEKVLNVLKEAENNTATLDTFKQQCEIAGVTCTVSQRICGRLKRRHPMVLSPSKMVERSLVTN